MKQDEQTDAILSVSNYRRQTIRFSCPALVLLFRRTEVYIVVIGIDMKVGGRLDVYFITVLPESGFQRLLLFRSERNIYRIHVFPGTFDTLSVV
jgi:hypothetical protein